MWGRLFLVVFSCFGVTSSWTFGESSTFISPPATGGKLETIHWFNTYDAALHQAAVQKKPVLILFTGTSWCPACKKLEKEVLTHSRFGSQVADQFIFLKADFRAHSGDKFFSSPFYQLLEKYQVQYFPTFVVVDSQGEELFRVDYQPGGVDDYTKKLLSGIKK